MWAFISPCAFSNAVLQMQAFNAWQSPNILAHKWGGGGGPPLGEFNGMPPKTTFQKTSIFSRFFATVFVYLLSRKPWKYQFSLGKITIFKDFAKIVFLLFPCIFGQKNLPKTIPKRSPNPLTIDAKNGLFFNFEFLGFWPRFGSLLGLQVGAKMAQNGLQTWGRYFPGALLS